MAVILGLLLLVTWLGVWLFAPCDSPWPLAAQSTFQSDDVD